MNISKFLAVCGAAFVLASCIKSADVPVERPEAYGSLAVSQVSVTEITGNKNHNHTSTRAGEELSAAGFDFRITRAADGTEMYRSTCGEVSRPLELPADDYTLTIQSHEPLDAEWDRVHYSLVRNFTITAEETTTLDDLVCKVSSILVSVRFSDNIKAVMDSDSECEVEVYFKEGSPLVFEGNDDARIACFRPEEENTLHWNFAGVVYGEEVFPSHFIDGVKAGEHRTLVFNVVEKGMADFDFDVTVECETVDIYRNIEIKEEIVKEPSDPEPPTDKISITGPGIEEAMIIRKSEASTTTVRINIVAEEGIAELLVDMSSSSALFGAAVDMIGTLNMTHPSESNMELLGLPGMNLPYGDAVLGKDSLLFDISSFISLIFLTDSENPDFTADFKLTVTDAEGNTLAKTVRLRLINDQL